MTYLNLLVRNSARQRLIYNRQATNTDKLYTHVRVKMTGHSYLEGMVLHVNMKFD